MNIFRFLLLALLLFFAGCSSHKATKQCPYKKLQHACQEGCDESCKKLADLKDKKCDCKDCKKGCFGKTDGSSCMSCDCKGCSGKTCSKKSCSDTSCSGSCGSEKKCSKSCSKETKCTKDMKK